MLNLCTGDTIGVGIVIDSYNQRRLYFTKNGQLLDFYAQRVHIGMDCFPAVSFTRGSGVEFEVKLTGPFKFDPNSLPNYRPDRVNRFESIPSEIMGICFAYVATKPSQAALLRRVRIESNVLTLGSNVSLGFKEMFRSCWRQYRMEEFVLEPMAQTKRQVECQVVDQVLQAPQRC